MFFRFKIHHFPFHMFMNSTSKIHFTYFTGFKKFKLLCTTLEIIVKCKHKELLFHLLESLFYVPIVIEHHQTTSILLC